MTGFWSGRLWSQLMSSFVSWLRVHSTTCAAAGWKSARFVSKYDT